MNQRVIVCAKGSVGGEGRADELFPAPWTGTPGAPVQGSTQSKGEQLYSWARIRINEPTQTGEHWLSASRSLKDPTDPAYLIWYAPERATLIELARVAGAIEETIQASKGETGLDHFQVRQYAGWYRHITLSMFAYPFLSVIRSKKGAPIRAPETW